MKSEDVTLQAHTVRQTKEVTDTKRHKTIVETDKPCCEKCTLVAIFGNQLDQRNSEYTQEWLWLIKRWPGWAEYKKTLASECDLPDNVKHLWVDGLPVNPRDTHENPYRRSITCK